MPDLSTPEERSRRSQRAHRLGRKRIAAFGAWLASERAAGREPSIEERGAERARIRGATSKGTNHG